MNTTADLTLKLTRSNRVWLAAAAVMSLAAYVVDDWIAPVAVGVLWLAWHNLRDDDGLPILPMAITFQWVQVTLGVWYHALTGRPLATMILSDYRPMVLIGLGCVTALTLGLSTGMWLIRRSNRQRARASVGAVPIGWTGLIILYFIALGAQGGLVQFAYELPDLTQAILTLRFVHLALLFLILRRLSRPTVQWHWIALVLIFEIVLGITGFFAGYREPIVMAVIALFEIFNPRRVQHWVGVTVFGVMLVAISLFWISVRTEYRKEFDNETFAQSRGAQFDKMSQLSLDWWKDSHNVFDDMDRLVDRMWVVYYPALAVARVPSVLPHTDGAFTSAAVLHVLSPRVFFPSKAELKSDSEMVRKYSGVWVAGAEQNTSIAFGYAGESYIDFGVPMMFLPVFVYGLVAGLAYQTLSMRVHHEELRSGLLAVIFWLALYLFERSWVKTIGLLGTLLVYLGGPALLLDYYLNRFDKHRRDDPFEQPAETEQWT
jgi:hypothetical protein